jgi:NAD(P)H-dependent flavin oxidoreductase YrpB (nitropropane dioxygenase family)
VSALHTRFCDLVGVRYPIVQTGMGWVSGARLTAATAAAGGLGILASATMTLPELRAAIAEVKARTDAPFGVNLYAGQPDLEQRLALLVEQEIKVASFARAPGRDAIARLKDAGIVCMPTIGAVRHAEKVVEWGVDAVIAQGHEGGGHTGAIPTSILLPAVCRAVDVPVLGAGGFQDGRGLVAALAYGASGIAMGTRFLLTAESTVPDSVKAKYLAAGTGDTVVTLAVDGLPQRVIRTKLIAALEAAAPTSRLVRAARHALAFRASTGTSLGDFVRSGLDLRRTSKLSWSQLMMAANAPMMTRAGLVEGKPEVGILPTGQVAGLIGALPTVDEVVRGIVNEAEEVLARLGEAP